MRNIYYIILLLSLDLLSGCRKDAGLEPMGTIHLTLTDRVETKAMPDALSPELTDQFMIKMTAVAEEKLVFGGTCAAFNAKAQLFKSGEYTIVASYGINPALAMDAPFYTSEVKTFTVEAGREQAVTLHCCVGNALASFELMNKDKLDKVLKDYYVEVVANGQTVKWYPGSAENPYFKAGSEVAFYLKGIWIENNQPYSKKISNILLVVPGKRYNYKLKFDTSNMTGVILDIQVDASVETITVNQTLPPSWLPKPKITADGFDENNLMTYTETEDAHTAIISYAAIRPVEDVEMTLEFADPNLLYLNKTYLFSALSESDRTALLAAGILLPTVDGASMSGTINLTAMTQSLLTKAGGVDAENVIKLRVKANDRWSDEANFTIKTVKPLFNISVYPGNIWTKEFTANPLVADSVKTGNYNRFKDITYEFSIDGSNWEPLAIPLYRGGLNPGTAYYVRPKYRGEVPGETTALRTYEALSIPNCTLNEGYTNTNPKKNNPLYSFDGGWIGTRNTLTCHSNGANAFYVSKSSTLPVSDNGSTVAHMMTIGWGAGNTCSFGNKSGSVINNISAGIVCVGDYNAEQDSIHAKKAYIRPTSLSFVYKASPYGDDEYLINIQLVNITDHKEIVIGKALMKSGIAQASYVVENLNINYDDQCNYLPITHVRILFKAGTKEDRDHLEDKFTKEGSGSLYSNSYIKGSQFWLDSFVLNYDK